MSGPHDAHLEALRDDFHEIDAEVKLRLGEGDLPDQLYVEMEPDDRGRVLNVQAMFLPGDLEIPVLQIYVGLPYTVAPDSLPELLRFLHLANANTPIGEFGYVESAGLLYFRYNAAVRVDPFDRELAAAGVAMASYLVSALGPVVEEVAARGAFDEAALALSAVIARTSEDFGAD